MMLNSLRLLKWMGSGDTQYFAGLVANEQRKQASVLCHQMCSSNQASYDFVLTAYGIGVNAQVMIKKIKWK